MKTQQSPFVRNLTVSPGIICLKARTHHQVERVATKLAAVLKPLIKLIPTCRFWGCKLSVYGVCSLIEVARTTIYIVPDERVSRKYIRVLLRVYRICLTKRCTLFASGSVPFHLDFSLLLMEIFSVLCYPNG